MFFGTPEELQQHLRQQLEEVRLNAEEYTRKLSDFIDGLSEDDLMMLRTTIRQVTQDDSYGQYLNGWISCTLSSKYNICQYCGGKHESPEDWITAHAGMTGSPNIES